MTENGNFKRRVRTRAAKTGESYTAALRHIREPSSDGLALKPKSVRLGVAQTTPYFDPRNIHELRESGLAIRRLMREARQAGARIVHFPEGAICSPSKHIMSVSGPQEVGPADWGRVEWAVLRDELNETKTLAGELELWIVLGSVHQLSQPRRPHNSLYIISDRGDLVTRYDERLLSNTKNLFMYTPGSNPVTFEVDGLRFGCALGMEAHYPEIFVEYERLNVHCVLFSSMGASESDLAFAVEMQGHAASHSYWTSLAVHAHSLAAPSGIVAPGGKWAAQCAADGSPSIAVIDINDNPGDLARPWRRKVRAGIYEPHLVGDDPRSVSRDMF
jgi:predicted amidohydrolase